MKNEENMKITRARRELQCEGAITKYYKDTVVLPDGRTEKYDFVGHNGAAAAVLSPDIYRSSHCRTPLLCGS